MTTPNLRRRARFSEVNYARQRITAYFGVEIIFIVASSYEIDNITIQLVDG